MLLRCPTCAQPFSRDGVRPRSGTAICAAHGEVRPEVRHPVLDEPAASPGGWTATWTRNGSAYRYEAKLDRSFNHEIGWRQAPKAAASGLAGAAEWAELGANAIPLAVFAVPALAIGYLERRFAGRIRIDRDRIRVGRWHWWHENVGAFAVRSEHNGEASLVATQFLQIVLGTPKAPEELGTLCHELNEALLVVQHCEPPPAKLTPYRD